MNICITLYCHSLLIYVYLVKQDPQTWNTFRSRPSIPFFASTRAPDLALGRGFVLIKYFWMNQWTLKDHEHTLFLLFFLFFSWPWMEVPHVWCNLAPFTFSPGNEGSICELSMPSVLTKPHQKRCLKSSEPDYGLKAPDPHWEKKVSAVVTVCDRLVPLWFYGPFKDT